MIIILIVILWLISLSLRLTSAGIVSLHLINNKIVDKKVENNKDKKNIKKATKVANKASLLAIKTIRMIIDLFRYLLSSLLPVVLVLDIIVFVLIIAVSSTYLLLLDVDNEKVSSSTKNNTVITTVSANDNNNNTTPINEKKSKVLLIGDSRTVQLGMTVFNMSTKADTDGISLIIGQTSSNDYIYSKGSMGLSWLKSQEDKIDKQVDENTAVVVNMGVNDCLNSNSSKEYISYMNSKSNDWKDKNAEVYFVSVNPINDFKARLKGYGVTNNHVITFNKKVKDSLNSNIVYIDTYSKVKSMVDKNGTEDGIHYTKEVYKKIKKIIWNKVKS